MTGATRYFMSQDQVALESVCFDFLRSEWNGKNKHSDANNVFEKVPTCSVWMITFIRLPIQKLAGRIVYDPDKSGKPLPSLGVHEHWNNAE